VLDDSPVLLDSQLRLWRWIADYYMSPIGEVYKAALPSGLKAEDGYKPKTELYIGLTPQFRNENALHTALNMLHRADRQLAAFVDYLALSHWDTLEGSECRESVVEITRDELMNASHATLQTLNALVKRGLLETYEREVGRLNHGGEPHLENVKPLNAPQLEAFNQIQFSFLKKSVTLLHGVTSSGKTEIYIHLIRQALEQHQQVLYLLPEIALTVQIMQRLQHVFGNRLGIYHSKYSDAERVEIWQKQLSQNPYDVILGARSAVLLPFQNLGLVIVDEEHETSYKQQDPMPRYHARSAAIILAQMFGAKTLLGTATPSMETYHNAKTGKYGLVELSQRYKGIEMPEIQIVDIKDLQHRKMMNGPFSPVLLARVREALERGEQAILFQNRRGYAPMIECKQCGWVPHCQHCDVSLTLHRNMNQLTCHYCGYTYQVPTECPNCGCTQLQTRGYGTEKIEDVVRDIFPEAHIARMDLDTTRSRHAYERIISDFSAGRTNLLIGTQMISKGLDFDKVSVVGILNADTMLNYPDFRAYEHAFMMMAQVSGRAGRKGKRGLVILQTKSPDLPVIQQVVHNDYSAFYRSLVTERRQFHYPPYYRLVDVYLKHRSDSLVETAGIELGSRLRQWFGSRVLGPDKPSVAKVKSLSIRKLVLKLELGLNMADVRKYLTLAQQQMLQDKRYASLQIYYDVDPL
jgi:primosomal protein N' (replication factor Y)